MLEGHALGDHVKGDTLLGKGQIFDSALQEFQEAMRHPREARKAFAELALCLKTVRRDEEAVTALRQALGRDSFSFNERVYLLYLLAHTLESLEREFEALVIYRQIRRLHPDFYDVDSRIQELSSGKLPPPAALQLISRRGGWSSQVVGRTQATIRFCFKPSLASTCRRVDSGPQSEEMQFNAIQSIDFRTQ